MKWRARIFPKRLIIAAASSRPFVRAATAAGYQAVAADVFCDADTRRDALQVIRLGYTNGGFEAAEIRRLLLPMLADDVGFIYGSGFETQPQLLEEIARHCQLLGNTAETVGIVKDPHRFFSLLSGLGIQFPETTVSLPVPSKAWLSKRIGGSGGTHVQRDSHQCGPNHYFQQRLPGQPFSLLFLADGRQAGAIGYNEQWLAPSPEMPYRFGGAVSQASLPASVRSGMLDAAQLITTAIGLRGLNSLDCMVDGERFWVLEVNPRLSATFALYDASSAGASLFKAHLGGCVGKFAAGLPPERARAHLVYYAPFDITVSANMRWPAWVADIPVDGIPIKAGEPLCTITAAAQDANGAKRLAYKRAGALTQRITELGEWK